MSNIEWNNGDECNYMNSPVKHYFVGLNPMLESHCYIISDGGYVYYVNVIDLSKPETPEQKAERERMEAAYDLYLTRLSVVEDYFPYTYDEFLNAKGTRLGFLAIVDKTNYRKQ